MTSHLENKLIIKKYGKLMIFDKVRKKYVTLTKEEFVRQNIIHILHEKYNYPLSLMRIEKRIKKKQSNQRADIVINNTKMQTTMLVECKAYNIPIDQQALRQVLKYNFILEANIILITNGIINICYQGDKKNGYEIIHSIPQYSSN